MIYDRVLQDDPIWSLIFLLFVRHISWLIDKHGIPHHFSLWIPGRWWHSPSDLANQSLRDISGIWQLTNPFDFFCHQLYQHWSQSNVFCESQRVKGLWSSCHVVGPCRSYLPSIYEDLHIHKAAPSSPWEHEGPKVKRIFQHLSLPPRSQTKVLDFLAFLWEAANTGSSNYQSKQCTLI